MARGLPMDVKVNLPVGEKVKLSIRNLTGR